MSGWSDLGYEWRMCGRKTRFATRGDALRCQPTQHAYQCPVCFKWHLTKRRPT